jgi:folate-dependent tRNA-U54 methylase TrmFO/GidA
MERPGVSAHRMGSLRAADFVSVDNGHVKGAIVQLRQDMDRLRGRLFSLVELAALPASQEKAFKTCIAALVTALIVAGGVYSKQRYDDEKAKRAWYDNGVDRRQADG